MIGPDATVTLDFALARATGLIDKLVVYPEQMERNLEQHGGLHNSQRVLLALTQAGMSREAAYSVVQTAAMEAWRNETPFLALLKEDEEISGYLTNEVLESLFDLEYHTKNVDTIFKRVFGTS
jgi:adenylosuccinate lyase